MTTKTMSETIYEMIQFGAVGPWEKPWVGSSDDVPDDAIRSAVDEAKAASSALNGDPRDERLDAMLYAMANIRHDTDEAYYVLHDDEIYIPPFEAFRTAKDYYLTLLHEVVHWTRHSRRLNRHRKGRGPRVVYAREELVAEIGSAILAAELGLSETVDIPHAQYIKAWLPIIKPKSVPAELAQSEKFARAAVDYILDRMTMPELALAA